MFSAVRFLAEDSGNVDESGNFSLQVLSKAVERSHSLQLVSAASEGNRKGTDIAQLHEGFGKYNNLAFVMTSVLFQVCCFKRPSY
jgi:hypothetical protein